MILVNLTLLNMAKLTTGSGIGTFDAYVDSSKTHLRYTPPANVDVETRVFQQAIQLV